MAGQPQSSPPYIVPDRVHLGIGTDRGLVLRPSNIISRAHPCLQNMGALIPCSIDYTNSPQYIR